MTLTVCLQKIRLRGLPAIDSIGGPAEGLTYIVTGPTRSAVILVDVLHRCVSNFLAAFHLLELTLRLVTPWHEIQ